MFTFQLSLSHSSCVRHRIPFCVAAAIDLKGIQNTRYNDNEDDTYIIGDYNFDPLNLYPIDKEGQDRSK